MGTREGEWMKGQGGIRKSKSRVRLEYPPDEKGRSAEKKEEEGDKAPYSKCREKRMKGQGSEALSFPKTREPRRKG